jgi:2-haloacid dehalogenase
VLTNHGNGLAADALLADRWLSFDCYGTLVDWRAGIAQAIEFVAPGKSGQLLPVYYRHEAEIQAGSFRPYREVLDEGLRQALSEFGWSLPQHQAHVLSESLPTWPVFDDVGPSLAQVRLAGWKLAILSNVDPDLFAETRKRLPVAIEALITAQDVGSYKPAPGHFRRFRQLHQPGVHIHVAQSWLHDIRPAHNLGIPAIWINRLGEREETPIAAAVLPELRDLPQTTAKVGEEL